MSKWHPTTKGTLRRNYRVPSKSEGRRLLKGIASLLSDDDHFIDATSHKVIYYYYHSSLMKKIFKYEIFVWSIVFYFFYLIYRFFTFVEIDVSIKYCMLYIRVVKLEGRALMEKVSVATTSGLCLMSFQLHTLLWKLLLFLLGLLQIRIIPKLRN